MFLIYHLFTALQMWYLTALIKNIVLKHHQVKFNNAPERPGDAKHTLANLEKIKNIGWVPKLNSLEQIEKCFRSIS